MIPHTLPTSSGTKAKCGKHTYWRFITITDQPTRIEFTLTSKITTTLSTSTFSALDLRLLVFYTVDKPMQAFDRPGQTCDTIWGNKIRRLCWSVASFYSRLSSCLRETLLLADYEPESSLCPASSDRVGYPCLCECRVAGTCVIRTPFTMPTTRKLADGWVHLGIY